MWPGTRYLDNKNKKKKGRGSNVYREFLKIRLLDSRAKYNESCIITMPLFLFLLNQCFSSLHVFLYERILELGDALLKFPFEV